MGSYLLLKETEKIDNNNQKFLNIFNPEKRLPLRMVHYQVGTKIWGELNLRINEKFHLYPLQPSSTSTHYSFWAGKHHVGDI